MPSAPHATTSYPTPQARPHARTASPVPSSAAVVLAVRELREEVRAGYGNASFRMRMLDNVSLNVHAGEFVVVRGDRASGAHALRAVLAGTRVVRSGIRTVAEGVSVRHATVAWDAVRAMLEGWHAAPRRSSASTPHDVFVFRVCGVPPVETTEASRERNLSIVDRRWRTWAASVRARHGSVVAQIPWTDEPEVVTSTYAAMTPQQAQRTSPTVHEDAVGDDRSYGAFYQSDVATVRAITLAGGRIVSAVPMTRQTLMGRGCADALPTACDPCSTAWTES